MRKQYDESVNNLKEQCRCEITAKDAEIKLLGTDVIQKSEEIERVRFFPQIMKFCTQNEMNDNQNIYL